MQHYKTIVVGAGISGISAGKLLRDRGEDYLVLEGNRRPGGLVKCDTVEGHLYHRVGGHVFNTKIPRVADWFWGAFNKDEEFLAAERNAGIRMNGTEMGYPIENHLYMLPGDLQEKVLTELGILSQKGRRDPFSYSSFGDFLKGNFGETLFRLYFEPYNHKIWQTDLFSVALPWLEGKLPMPDYEEIIRSNRLHGKETAMVHSRFFYPRKYGSQFIVDRLAEGLHIQTAYQVESLERANGRWIVNGELEADQLIYTGDIRKLSVIIRNPGYQIKEAADGVSGLRSNGTSNLLCETDETPFSWLYLPDRSTPAHRIIFTGNFSPANKGSSLRPSCTVEFSGKTGLEEMKAALKKLPYKLRYIDHNYEENSYVIQYRGDRERIAALRTLLEKEHFYLSGRFAEWEYYNMDKAMERAMQIVDSIG